jgi:hypothetical protein
MQRNQISVLKPKSLRHAGSYSLTGGNHPTDGTPVRLLRVVQDALESSLVVTFWLFFFFFWFSYGKWITILELICFTATHDEY